MTKEQIIDNIARLNSETWRDREEVRTEIGKLLTKLEKALEKDVTDTNVGKIDSDCVSRQALIEYVESKYQSNWWNVDEVLAKIKALPPVTPTRKVEKIKKIEQIVKRVESLHPEVAIGDREGIRMIKEVLEQE